MFKRRAAELEKLLKEAGYTNVVTNPEKPRKGYFSLMVGEEEVYCLASLPRPFSKLREADLAAVVKNLASSASDSAAAAEPSADSGSAAAPVKGTSAGTAATKSSKGKAAGSKRKRDEAEAADGEAGAAADAGDDSATAKAPAKKRARRS